MFSGAFDRLRRETTDKKGTGVCSVMHRKQDLIASELLLDQKSQATARHKERTPSPRAYVA